MICIETYLQVVRHGQYVSKSQCQAVAISNSEVLSNYSLHHPLDVQWNYHCQAPPPISINILKR